MYRSEIALPVHRDSRTFEEGRRDLLNNLENSLRSRHTSTSTVTSTTSSTTQRQQHGTTGNSLALANDMFEDDWDMSVSQWIRDARAKMSTDVQRMRHDFFRLEPADSFGSGMPISNWPAHHQLDSGASGRTMTTVQQSSTVTKSTTVGGHTTSNTQQSNSFSTSTGGHQSILDKEHPSSGTLQLTSNLDNMSLNKKNLEITNAFSQSKDLYELGEDRQMHFKVRFDASEFSPEDIQVTTAGNRLTVKARVEKKTANSSSFKEMSRSVELPDRIDHDKFSCVMTKDNVLVIDAPVHAPNYKAISFHNGELGIKPIAASELNSANSSISTISRQLQVTGRTGTQLLSAADGAKRMHVELPVERDYLPTDIHVRAEGHKIFVKGTHHENSGGRSSMKEFSKYYEVPEALDPLSVVASLQDGTLVIEAPLLHQ